jgi:hypothetical protein
LKVSLYRSLGFIDLPAEGMGCWGFSHPKETCQATARVGVPMKVILCFLIFLIFKHLGEHFDPYILGILTSSSRLGVENKQWLYELYDSCCMLFSGNGVPKPNGLYIGLSFSPWNTWIIATYCDKT